MNDVFADVARVYRTYGEGHARARLVSHGWTVDAPERLEAALNAVRQSVEAERARERTHRPHPPLQVIATSSSALEQAA